MRRIILEWEFVEVSFYGSHGLFFLWLCPFLSLSVLRSAKIELNCIKFLNCIGRTLYNIVSIPILQARSITVLMRIYYPSPKNCGREEGILNYSLDWNTKEAGHLRHQHWGQVRPAPKLHKLKIFKQSLWVIKMVYHFSCNYIFLFLTSRSHEIYWNYPFNILVRWSDQ